MATKPISFEEWKNSSAPPVVAPKPTPTKKPNFTVAFMEAQKKNPNLTSKEFEKTFIAQDPGNAAYLEATKAKNLNLAQTNQQKAQDEYLKNGGKLAAGEVYDPYATLRDMSEKSAAGSKEPAKTTMTATEANKLRQSATGQTINYKPSTGGTNAKLASLMMNAPTPPGAGSSPKAAAAYEKSLKVYKENQQLADALQKSFQDKKGLEVNMGQEIQKIKAANAQLQGSLNDELGFPDADNLISNLEESSGIVIDKTDENLKNQLKALIENKNNGTLDNNEFTQLFNNTLLKAGKPVTDYMTDEPQIGEGISATSEEVFGGGLQSQPGIDGMPVPIMEKETVHPGGAVTNNESGVTTYKDPKSNLNFVSVPNQKVLDLTKLTPEEIGKLDGVTLLKAEQKMFTDLADEDIKSQDAFYEKLSQNILNQQETTKSTILSYSQLKEDSAKVEKMQALDDIAYQQNQLDIEKAETFEEIADAESKTEGYMKGKLSAMGGSQSSAALAIMSGNKLKFAKAMSSASAKFSAESKHLQSMATSAQLAFTNSLVSIQMDTNKSLVDLATGTQNSLMDIMGQKLSSDSQKRQEKTTISLNYIKGIKDLKSSQAQAAAQAEKDAQDFFMKGLDLSDKLSDTRGTVWEFTPDGQLYDTGKPTLKASTDMNKLDLDKQGLAIQQGHLDIDKEKLGLDKEKQAFDMQMALTKLKAGSGGGGGSGGSGGGSSSTIPPNTLVSQLRNSVDPQTGELYTDESIANALPTLYGSAAGGLKNIQGALNELNTTPNTATGEGASPFYIPQKKKELSEMDKYFQALNGGVTGGGGSPLTAGINKNSIPKAGAKTKPAASKGIVSSLLGLFGK